MIDQLRITTGGLTVAFAATAAVCFSAEIDAYEVDIEELKSNVEIVEVEQRFSKIAEIRSLLANCGRCFRHITKAELRQLHDAAKLTRTEFLTIERDLELAVRKASLEICQDRLRRGQLQRSGWTGGNQLGQLAPITIVEDALLLASQRHLGNERCEAYRSEVRARKEYRKMAVVEAMVASLDSRLFLTSDQRTRVSNVLKQEWQDAWLLCIRQLLNKGIEVMPVLPKQQIQSHLTSPQQTLCARLDWKPCTAPAIGPIELTMLGYKQKGSRLVDELQFVPENRKEIK